MPVIEATRSSSRRREDQHSGVGEEPGESHQEGDRVAVSLVQVFPHHHDGLVFREIGQQVEHGAEHILWNLFATDPRTHGGGDVEERTHGGDSIGQSIRKARGEIADDLAGQAEWDTAIERCGVTSEAQGPHPCGSVDDLRRHPGLADSAVATNECDRALPALGLFEALQEPGDGRVATDQRRRRGVQNRHRHVKPLPRSDRSNDFVGWAVGDPLLPRSARFLQRTQRGAGQPVHARERGHQWRTSKCN